MEAIVFIILYIFFTTHAVLKIREYSRMFLNIPSRNLIASKRKYLNDYK